MNDEPSRLTITVYRSRSLKRNQRYRWRVRDLNGKLLGNGGEGYSDRKQATDMAWYLIGEAHQNARVVVQ